jgi:hypothetical protein
VAQAVGYDLFLSIEGGAVQKVGSTDGAGSTSLAFTLPNAPIAWYVEARFAGCPPARSQTFGFTVEQPDTCALHTSAPLISPLGGTVPSSVIDFQWDTVLHVSGYRVWASVDGAPFAALGKTDETKFHAIIPLGKVEWFVESLFPGCPSTESLHASFTVPAATSCNNPAATPTAPGNGSTVNNQSIDFTWTAAAGAIGYEVYIALNSGSPALIGSTDPSVTTLHQDVAPGSLDWFVRALFNGCPGVDSTHFQFVFAPPPACPTQRPVLTAPGENAIGLTSPVSFEWGAVPGASYKLHYSLNHGDAVTVSTTETHLNNVSIDPGEVTWSVEAIATGCPSLASPDSTFTVVPPPLPCSTPDTTDIRAEANASSGNNYTVRWNPIPGAVLYDLQESLSPSFIPATQLSVTATEQSFSHTNTASTDPVYYFYRVRGVNNCNATHGLFSDPISVGILPPQQTATFNTTGATPVENPQPTTYQLHICSSAGVTCSFIGGVGQTFTATADQPWLTLSPASGIVTAAAITLTITANPATLPVGTNTASVTVSFSGGASSTTGRKAPHGNTTTSSSNISVNLVAPTTNKPKDTPPPDALIVPAVAHSDGVSSHFDTDVRVSNTSPQPMKYQLTFTPSGDSGIKDGKQTTIDIDPGRTVALDDVLQSWFGTGANSQGATGALEIRPLTTSATSVSSSAVSSLQNIVTFATSRTYSLLGNGSLGTIVPAIPYANFIGKSTSTSSPSVLSLQQIAQTSAFRTNLGLVEGSGQAATVLVSVFGSNGSKLTEFSQNLTGGQHLQLNSVLATQNLNNVTDGRIEVKVTSATGKVTAYASVLDNSSNDAQLVSPVSLSLAGSAKFVLPGVADLTNDQGKTQTDARLFNASSSAVTATLSLHIDGSPNNVLSKDVTIAAGEVKTLDNVMQTLFGVSNLGTAALHITTAAPTNLIATAKTYNQIGSGTVAQFISAVTPTNTIALGNRPLQLLQVEESNRFSTDVGVAEVSGKPVDLEITIIPPDAKVTAKTTVSLGANEFHNMHQLLSSIGLDGTYNARVTVRVVGGDGHATAYASVTDKATHDPTFVPAQ